MMPNKNPVSHRAGMRKEYKINLIPYNPLLQIKSGMLVGHVFNRKNETVAIIIVDDDHLVDLNIRELSVEDVGLPLPKIIITVDFLNKLIRKSRTALFAIYHELGHTRQKNLKGLTYEENRKERRAAVREGRVSKAELDADLFAAQHLGIDTAIKALTQFKEERRLHDKEIGKINTSPSIMSLQEYDYRIKAMQELKEKLNKNK